MRDDPGKGPEEEPVDDAERTPGTPEGGGRAGGADDTGAGEAAGPEEGVPLPTVSSGGGEPPDAPEEGGVDTGSPGDGDGPGPGEIEIEEPSSLRLVATLTLAGAIAGLVLVLVHLWAEPRIEAHRARRLRAAIEEVLGGPERWETVYLDDGRLVTDPGPGLDTANAQRVYRGYDETGRPVGFAITGEKPGFQDIVSLIFGYDAAEDEVLGMKVLENKETPGLGDRIVHDSAFIREFEGVEAPLRGVKARSGTGDPHEVDMITGATISSRTVIEIINERISELGPVLDEAGSTARSGPGDGPTTDATARARASQEGSGER